jgi:hypothetical protein
MKHPYYILAFVAFSGVFGRIGTCITPQKEALSLNRWHTI